MRAPEGESRNSHALNQQVRVAPQQDTVLEGTWFGLVAVAHQVHALGILGQEAPLDPGGETRAAAAAQIGLSYLLNQLFPPHAKSFFERLPSAFRPIDLELLNVADAEVLGDDLEPRRLAVPAAR